MPVIKNLVIDYHAFQRYRERFGHSPITLENAFKDSVPFGGWRRNTEYYINVDHEMVFVIDLSLDYSKKTLITVLTKPQAMANIQKFDKPGHHVAGQYGRAGKKKGFK